MHGRTHHDLELRALPQVAASILRFSLFYIGVASANLDISFVFRNRMALRLNGKNSQVFWDWEEALLFCLRLIFFFLSFSLHIHEHLRLRFGLDRSGLKNRHGAAGFLRPRHPELCN